jgi:hypothetical protein
MTGHLRFLALVFCASIGPAHLAAQSPDGTILGSAPRGPASAARMKDVVTDVGVPVVHFGADFRAMSEDQCSRKAMDAMYDQHFIEGTRSPGFAWGYNEQSLVFVRCVAQNQGVTIEVFAASRSGEEAERLRNEIRISVFDDRRPGDMVYHNGFRINGPLDQPTRANNSPPAHWGFDTRPKSLRGCMSGARLAMHKTGLAASAGGPALLWGSSPRVVVLVSCVPTDRGVSILVAATSFDGAIAERFRNSVRTITFDSVLLDDGDEE